MGVIGVIQGLYGVYRGYSRGSIGATWRLRVIITQLGLCSARKGSIGFLVGVHGV